MTSLWNVTTPPVPFKPGSGTPPVSAPDSARMRRMGSLLADTGAVWNVTNAVCVPFTAPYRTPRPASTIFAGVPGGPIRACQLVNGQRRSEAENREH